MKGTPSQYEKRLKKEKKEEEGETFICKGCHFVFLITSALQRETHLCYGCAGNRGR